MKVFVNYCTLGFGNCYVIGTDFSSEGDQLAEREAVIVDPGRMDAPILEFIETNKYKVKAVLITHDHENHTYGLRALMRIYDVDIYGAIPVIQGFKTIMVKDGASFSCGNIEFETIAAPGHSADSMIYKINHLLFTGDVLSSGLVGKAMSNYGAIRQAASLQNKIFCLPGNFLIFPGHGPPSTLEAERLYNEGRNFAKLRSPERKRPAFLLPFD
jgi:glyoxylase-like metal-dependent hydrolase (beta-lactamase superfamily II)